MALKTQYQPYGLPGQIKTFIAKAEVAGFVATEYVSVLDQYRFPQIPDSFDAELRAFLLDLQQCLNVMLARDFLIAGTMQTGGFVAGLDGAMRGVVTLWDGDGGNTPGYVKICQPDGTPMYLWVDDTGDLRIHNDIPTAAEGTVVGAQS